MRYLSLFSGIEAATVAWKPLGWDAVAFAEIEPFCCDLLEKRYPDVPNVGDVSVMDWSSYAGTVDLIVGGSPCQSFSIAGKRGGIMDSRGALMLDYIRAVRDIQPRWVLWENVPGVLSQSNGDAFETFQGELEQCGYSLAWRTLDAQFYGVAQRRRRVFLVGHARAGCAAAVLFERESLCWDSETSRDKRERLTENSERRFGESYTAVTRCGCEGGGKGALVSDDLSMTLSTANSQTLFQRSDCLNQWDVQSKRVYSLDGVSPTLPSGTNEGKNIIPSVLCGDDESDYIVRRLTPTECERLQGFPDGYTKLDDRTKDTPRYKALGNSMAVPVMRWIGERMQMVDDLCEFIN